MAMPVGFVGDFYVPQLIKSFTFHHIFIELDILKVEFECCPEGLILG